MNEQQKKEMEAAAPGSAFSYKDFSDLANDASADKLIDEADIIIGNVSPARTGGLSRLKWMQLFSAGANGYVDQGGFPQGALLTNATGAYGLSISEHMLGMLLMLQKRLHLYRDNQLQSVWRDEGDITSVEGAKTLVIGLGDIGGDFARKVKALGSYTIGVKRHASDKPDYLDELHLGDQIDRLLPEADIVALALPGTSETQQLISRSRLDLMKQGAIILNVGRGTAIDTDALCDHLESGHLAGAGLDVTDPEPLPENHRIWKIKNALITPHVSGGFHLKATQKRIAAITIENMRRFVSGQELVNIVDFSTGYRKFQNAD